MLNDLDRVWNAVFPPARFDAQALLALAWILVAEVAMMLLMSYAVRSKRFSKGRVFDVPIPPEQRKREFAHSWHMFLDATVLYVFIYVGLLRAAPFTWLDTLATLVIVGLWVEVYFYAVHRAMHAFKPLRPIHLDHHRSVVNTPYSGFASSLAEKAILLSFAVWFIAALSWLIDVTMAGVAAFYAYYYVIVIGGHCNTEFPVISRTMTRLGLATPSAHALHHARFDVNYGFGFVFLDRLFGTYSKETAPLRERALAGDGYRDLKRPAAD